jgi:hypothetical protein
VLELCGIDSLMDAAPSLASAGLAYACTTTDEPSANVRGDDHSGARRYSFSR